MMAVKLDLEKAYDRVRWSFLIHVLEAVGFDEPMVKPIMFTITTAQMSVYWNGQRLDPIQSQRGLRQEDPLAPYLFVLCMDVLSQYIHRAEGTWLWRPIRASRRGPAISHLFTDDLLFGVASVAQVGVMAAVIGPFCTASGQKVSTTSLIYMCQQM